MQPRFLFGLLAALALSAAACSDETPTLTGDEQFPPGSIPVTREVILPASAFFKTLGSFSGYSRASDAAGSYVVVANQYGGELNAHALARFRGFPTTVTYLRNGVSSTSPNFTYVDSRLVLGVDTLTTAGRPFTVQVWEAGQDWHARSATWTNAVDTSGVQTAWTQPGGTRGELLGQGTYAAGDSLVITLPAAAVARLADTLSHGVVLTVAETGARVEFADLLLRAAVRPDSASPDTTLFFTAGTSGDRTTVYTPEQPDAPAGTVGVGGIRSARTLLELDLEQMVPGCAAGVTCPEVPLSAVQLNQVAILLRPLAVPRGFDALNRVPLALRLVDEPELGAAAPIGQTLLDQDAIFARGDSVVVLRVTGLTTTLASNDSLPRTFALVSELTNIESPPTFGAAFFSPDARLRIVYTLPARRPLP